MPLVEPKKPKDNKTCHSKHLLEPGVKCSRQCDFCKVIQYRIENPNDYPFILTPNYMYFKVIKSKKLLEDINIVAKLMQHAKNVALKLCKKYGGKEVYTNGNYVAGGIDAFSFAKEPDAKLWRIVGKKWQGLYYPRSVAANKQILKEISDLPRITEEELNKMLNFKADFVSGDSPGVFMVHIKSPKIIFGKEYHLIEVDDRIKYKKVSDMVEITGSEFKKLSEKISK